MYAELSILYSNYIKHLAHYKEDHDLLSMKIADVSQKIRNLSVTDMLVNYEFFDGFITQIINIFENQNFCKRTILFSNVIYLLFQDLLQIYKVFFILVNEVLERLSSMNADEAQKCFIIY